MIDYSFGTQESKKLVEVVEKPIVGFDNFPPTTKKRAYRIRRLADPHIRSKKIKGRLFYYYVRGTDKEIYLGSADTILRAVKG